MLKDATVPANMVDGEQCQFLLVVPRLGESAKPPPGTARWMRHDGTTARPLAGVALDVPHVATGKSLVDRVLSSEQNGNLP